MWVNLKNNFSPGNCENLPIKFYNIKDELTTIDHVVYKGSRIVFPKSMRREIKRKLHIGHMGIDITRLRARECVYWPGIDSEISDIVSSCSPCLEYRNQIPKETLIEHDIPREPWSKVATDVFHLFGNHYVLVVDYTSKYFEISQIPDIESSTVISHLKSIYARHGIPEIVVSDNGPE